MPNITKTADEWRHANPILRENWMGTESDTSKIKIGDGHTTWNALEYYGESSPGGSSLELAFTSGAPDTATWTTEDGGDTWVADWTGSDRWSAATDTLTCEREGLYTFVPQLMLASGGTYPPDPMPSKQVLGWDGITYLTGLAIWSGSSFIGMPVTLTSEVDDTILPSGNDFTALGSPTDITLGMYIFPLVLTPAE